MFLFYYYYFFCTNSKSHVSFFTNGQSQEDEDEEDGADDEREGEGSAAGALGGVSSDVSNDEKKQESPMDQGTPVRSTTAESAEKEAVPTRPARKAAAAGDLTGEEVGETSDGTAQKKNQASVSLALQVGPFFFFFLVVC